MAVIPATLQGNYISVQGGGSVQSTTTQSDVEFGVITSVYNGAWYTKVGDSVMFKVKDTIPVSQGGNSYLLIKECDLILVENPPA